MREVIKNIWYQVESIVEKGETERRYKGQGKVTSGTRDVDTRKTNEKSRRREVVKLGLYRIEVKRGPNSMTHDNRKPPPSLTMNSGLFQCGWYPANGMKLNWWTTETRGSGNEIHQRAQ